MEELRKLYADQEAIDQKIIELIEERMRNCEQITECKIAGGTRLIDRAADKAQVDRLTGAIESSLCRRGAVEVLGQLQSMARKRQYQILDERNGQARLPFIEVDHLETGNTRVVFQGVEGAYSHAAMCRFFGEDVPSFHVAKFRDAMEAIANGEADYAVLPIENSSAGIVADNYDLLVDFENYIVGEQVIRCEHVLMGMPGTKLEEITTVYSHLQALSQCQRFLNEHGNWVRIPYDNTALAAKKIAEDADKTHAAIGSAFAAKLYGLEVLKEHVYDNEANSTRFIIATNQRIFRKDAGKISICFELPHTSGALYSILSHFIYNGLNMTGIESRPIPGRNWEYHFFVDFEGNLAQSSVRTALRGIRSEAINLKILGNY